MRIAILTLGSRGDVQPYIALGQGLMEAGHAVRLLASQDFEKPAKTHGLEFWPTSVNAQEMMEESKEFSELLEQGNFLKIFISIAKATEGLASELMENGLAACRGMDLHITGTASIFIGAPLAEKLDIPLLQTYLFPFTPTKDFPSITLPPSLPNLGGAFNRLSQQFVRQLLWSEMQLMFNPARRKVLGLPPDHFSKPFHSNH
jgi:UDP:flavonoid glycosyltransferase YjiC (YdhE family)